MNDLGLLMFNRNETNGILANVKSLSHVVDEIVVVDSSAERDYIELRDKLKGRNVKLIKVPPVGYPPPYHSYALAKMSSQRVLYLDSDERVSETLSKVVRSMTECDAYYVPRFEVGISAYTKHIRLYERTKVTYLGYNHEIPKVTGRIGMLPAQSCILHYANYKDYSYGKSMRSLTHQSIIDSYQRQYTPFRLSQLIANPALRRMIGSKNQILLRPLALLVMYSDYVRTLIRGTNLWLARSDLRYAKARYDYFVGLTPKDQSRRLSIYLEMVRTGGISKYLGLDSMEFVEGSQFRSLKFSSNGTDNLDLLLQMRHERGPNYLGV